MNTQWEVTAQNIKCGGCAAAIQTGLQSLPGVEQVAVDVPTGQVRITGDNLDHKQITEKLAQLGYPVA